MISETVNIGDDVVAYGLAGWSATVAVMIVLLVQSSGLTASGAAGR